MKKNKSSNFLKHKHWLIIPLPIFVYILLSIIPYRIEIIGDFLDPGGYGRGSAKWASYIFYISLLCFIWNIFLIFSNRKKILSAIAILFWILVFFNMFFMRVHYSISAGSMVRNFHRGVVGYITNEVKRCVLREKYLPSDVTYGYLTKEETDAYVKKNLPPEVMFGNLICSERTAANVLTATLKTYADFMNIKNPYFPENDAVRFDGNNTNKSDRGYINLSSSGSNVIIKTCYGRICKDPDYRLSKTIEIK